MSGEPMVRVDVDPERCVGIGQCEILEGEVFEIDDDGIARVIGDGCLPQPRAETVAARCPSGAISFSPVP